MGRNIGREEMKRMKGPKEKEGLKKRRHLERRGKGGNEKEGKEWAGREERGTDI